MPFLPLPDDDEVWIPRSEVRRYGGPASATLAGFACNPDQAPCELPYTVAGREAMYKVGNLRRLFDALTFKHTADRAVTSRRRRESFKVSVQGESVDSLVPVPKADVRKNSRNRKRGSSGSLTIKEQE